MTDIYRTSTPPEPDDEEEQEDTDEEEEKPEPPNFPTFWIAVILFSIEGTLFFFKPEMGMLVLSGAFNVVLYSAHRIRIAHAHATQYEERMKKLQEEAKARATKEELAETKYERAALKTFMSMCKEQKVDPGDMMKKHCSLLSAQEVGPAAAYIQQKAYA